MNGRIPELTARDLRLSIGRMTIEASSPIEAQRLKDALPAAIERALNAGSIERTAPRRTTADRVASDIVAAIVAHHGGTLS